VIKQHFPLENLVFTLIAKASEIAPLAKKYTTDIQTQSITAPGFLSAIHHKATKGTKKHKENHRQSVLRELGVLCVFVVQSGKGV
jgi:hypothetical protein